MCIVRVNEDYRSGTVKGTNPESSLLRIETLAPIRYDEPKRLEEGILP